MDHLYSGKFSLRLCYFICECVWMKLEQLVTGLKLSKRLDKLLKERGMKVEAQFYWCEDLEEITHSKNCKPYAERTCGEHISAFLSGEILLKLPYRKDRWIWKLNGGENYYDAVWYKIGSSQLSGERFNASTPSESLGLMYEYLLKNNLLK